MKQKPTLNSKAKGALQASDACAQSDHYPNAETQKSIRNAQGGKNLTEYETLEEFAKKLGL